MQINFTKMQGLGNDFVVIDTCSKSLPLPSADDIKQMADRHFGIGFDQLLIIEPSKQPGIDFIYRVFNADGSEAGQSGNGARCVAKYVYDKGLTAKRELVFSIKGRIVKMYLEADGLVTVDVGRPITEPQQIPALFEKEALRYQLPIEHSIIEIGAVSVGNPHAVFLVDDVKITPVDKLGSLIEKHPMFPERVNANFMQIVDRKTIILRVYERGTGETLACGSGACASVVIGRLWGLLDEKVTVKFITGDLTISWQDTKSSIFMTGPAFEVFTGVKSFADLLHTSNVFC